MDVDQRVAYTKRILRVDALKKYKAVIVEYKQLEKELMGDKWDLSALKELSMGDFWTWLNKYGIGYDGDAYLVLDNYFDFEKEIWFELGKYMCRKH